MTTTTPFRVQRTFRIIVEIETTVMASPRERLGDGKTHERSYQALVQHLLAHPPALRHLLRASVVEALLEAQKLLEDEYGWGKTSDQQVLQPIIAELEPAAQAYFTEELEDGATVYHVDGCEATVTQFSVAELDKAHR
jgi:hypothetical protein